MVRERDSGQERPVWPIVTAMAAVVHAAVELWKLYRP